MLVVASGSRWLEATWYQTADHPLVSTGTSLVSWLYGDPAQAEIGPDGPSVVEAQESEMIQEFKISVDIP